MNKKGELVWDKMGSIILVVILLVVLLIVLYFMRGSLNQIWDKIVNMMRFGG